MKKVVATIAVTALIFSSWVIWRSRLSDSTIERVSQSEEMFRAVVRNLGFAEVTHNGQIFVVVRNSKETDAEFLARCDAVMVGTLSGEYCWESDCTGPNGPYHVKFCFPTQAQLDSIVASYCATHDCEACD